MSQGFLIQVHQNEPKYIVFDMDGSSTPPWVHRDMQREVVPDLYGAKLAIDIGANVGMWSFRMAKLYPDCKIVAYEPCKENVRHFEMGITENKLTNVSIHPFAVSENGNPLLLYMHKNNSGSASIYSPRDQGLVEEMVPSIPLNDLVLSHGIIDVMKVDIEGMEFHLFNGFTRWDKIKKLYLEVHPSFLFGTDSEKRATITGLLDLLRSKLGTENVFVDSADENFRGL